MTIDPNKWDFDDFDEELDPQTKKLIEELSEGLQPGEDWLHYDRDRLFPPPPAPPSEAKAHLVAAVPSAAESRGHTGASRARTAPTLQGQSLPFIPENAKQARAVRRRQLRKVAAIMTAAMVLLGFFAAIWAVLPSADPASAIGPRPTAAPPSAHPAVRPPPHSPSPHSPSPHSPSSHSPSSHSPPPHLPPPHSPPPHSPSPHSAPQQRPHPGAPPAPSAGAVTGRRAPSTGAAPVPPAATSTVSPAPTHTSKRPWSL